MRVKTLQNPNRPAGILRLLKAYLSQNRIGDLLVIKGRIAPDTLDYALVLARARGQKIGQVLLDEGMIRRHELYATLGTQWGVRAMAYTSALVLSFASFMPRQARADDGRAAAAITLAYAHGIDHAAQNHPSSSYARYPALFGSGEKRSDDLSAFTKWTSMFDRYHKTAKGNITPVSMSTSATQIESIAGLARDIDAKMNKIPYVEDTKNWGKSDFWATPDEFLTRGGDCEDFAIAKYMALKSAGVGDDRMRIAIVHDTVKDIPHAILIVYSEEGPLVLDNQSKETKRADELTRYKPIFSINQTAWWLHTQGADVQVASAAQ